MPGNSLVVLRPCKESCDLNVTPYDAQCSYVGQSFLYAVHAAPTSLYPGRQTNGTLIFVQADRLPTKGRPSARPNGPGRDGSGTREIAMKGQCNQIRTGGSETRESNERARTSQRQMLRPGGQRPTRNPESGPVCLDPRALARSNPKPRRWPGQAEKSLER